jgi:hypothetical protein
MSTLNKVMKQKFGYDVDGLAEYIDEQSSELIAKDVISSPTIDLVNIQEGVKSKEKIKLVDIDVTYQDGSDCAVTASGDVTYSDREMAVDPITVLIKLCSNDLLGTWGQLGLRAGSNAETQDIPNEAILLDYLLRKHRAELEKLVWRGDKTGGSGNLARANGFHTLFTDNIGSLVALNTGGLTELTTSNAYDAFYTAFEAMPEEVLENGASLFLGREWYTKLSKNLVDLNFFKEYTTNQLASQSSFILPGTDLTINRVPGLNTIDAAYIAKPNELVIGTDLMNDFEEITSWYEKKDDAMYIRVKFKVGTQVPYLGQIGQFTLAAS